MNKRILYIILAILFFIVGFILFMSAASMPLFIANYAPNILWACSIYFVSAFIFSKNAILHGAISTIICALFIIVQHYNFGIITFLRGNLLGAYIFGTSFLLSDIFCYITAIATCFIFDFIIAGKNKRRHHR